MLTGIDIMLRWLEAQNISKREELSKCLTYNAFWKEIGGVFLLYPRRYGKTTALEEFTCSLKKLLPNDRVVLVDPISHNLHNHQNVDLKFFPSQGKSWLARANPSTDHLIIDEFMYLDKLHLEELLSLPWQSVTAVSTMR